jgi:hypothetical protein
MEDPRVRAGVLVTGKDLRAESVRPNVHPPHHLMATLVARRGRQGEDPCSRSTNGTNKRCVANDRVGNRGWASVDYPVWFSRTNQTSGGLDDMARGDAGHIEQPQRRSRAG